MSEELIMTDEFKDIEISKIKSLENIRTRIKISEIQDLMQSIKQQGLLQPIGIWLTKEKEYIIAYGNRRLVACEKLGWKNITAKVIGELNYEDLLIINASENIHRKDITVAELGRICDLLRQKGLSRGEVAQRLSLPIGRVNLCLNSFKKIPEKHRKDIIFMKGGEKYKLGKISASMYNSVISLQRELYLDTPTLDKLLRVIKKEDLSLSQLKVISILLKEGATINEAMKELSDYNIRRISFPISKKVEAEMWEENGIQGVGSIAKLFRKLLRGEIRGKPGLTFSPRTNLREPSY